MDLVTPVEAFSADSANSSTPSALAVTATVGSRLVALYTVGGSNTINVPAAMTDRYLTGGTQVRARAADRAVTTTGATGAVGTTLTPANNQQWVAHLVSLRAPQNLAPIVGSVVGASELGEGSVDTYSISATDPEGDPLTYAWSVQSGDAAISGATDAAQASVEFGDGPGSVVLRVVVDDGHGHTVQRELTVALRNVAPGADFGASSPVVEGSAINLSLTDVTDPSTADSVAGFTYAFDCGSGFGDYGAASTASCPTTDDATVTVGGRVKDKDGDATEYTATVEVTNEAPTATFSADTPVEEGDAFGLSLTNVADVSSADTVAGFTYAFDCGAGYGAVQSTPSTTCPTTDNATHSVRATVTDKDGGSTEYAGTVGVDNAAPTATFAASSPVDEGDDIELTLSDPVDPSADDTAAGFVYAFDCDATDADPAVDQGSDTSATCATNDNGPRSVAGRVSDKDAGSTSYEAQVTIENVAPTGTFTPVSSVDEGSSFDLTLADVTDASSVDAATLEFAFDCGDGSFGEWGADTATCPTDDDAERTVRAKVRDKDGGESEYTATVTVANVAPTAQLVIVPDGDVDEGSDFTLSLADATDPSPLDAAALTYRFDCGNGWQDAGSQNSVTCPTDDNDVRDVRARVIDPDGDGTTYKAQVTVVNVSPVPTLVAPASVDEGSAIHLDVSDVLDPSDADTTAGFTFAFNCGGGYGAFGSTHEAICPTTDNEVREVGVKARDKDGGVGTATQQVNVLNIAPSATLSAADVDEGTAITLSLDDVSDPSPVDTVTFAFHCGTEAFVAFDESDFGPDTTASCPTDDNGTRTVTGAVLDDDGGLSVYSIEVSVANVAPSGVFTTGAVDEGSPINLSVTDVVDPSPADAAAGFTYRFDCGTGSGYGDWASVATASCPTADQGTRTVRAKVRDKDGAESESSVAVAVNSVAPQGAFTAPASLLEGDDIELAISDVNDPSPADTAAGFTYAFDCGAGFGAFGAAAGRTCATDDNGERHVGGTVQDKDLHGTTYTATVGVDNVAPSATFEAQATVHEGSAFGLALTGVTDPSSVDTAAGFSFAFDCGAGYGAFGAASTRSCPTVDDDVRTVKGTVRDKDGGQREYTATTTVLNEAPLVTAPAGQTSLPGVSTSFALGSFSDAGVADGPWTVDVSWGDGITGQYTAITQGAIASASHAYALAGSYTVQVRVTDKDGGASQVTFAVEVDLTDKVLLGQDEVAIAGARSQVVGNVHANRDVRITGAGGEVCGDLTAGLTVSSMSAQLCGTRATGVAVTVPAMTPYVPTTPTHTLTGDRVLNGYTCALAAGCVVKVTGKLELRGLVTGKVWFVVDRDVVVKGDLAPASATSRLRVYSRQAIDIAASKASVSGQFLAETGVKLSGSTQILTGLFWGRQYVDMSGSNGSLRGAVVSNGSVKLAGSSRTVTYDASVIKL